MPSTPVLLDNAQKIPLNPPLSKGEAEDRGISDRILPALLASMLGLALLYAAGFADTAQLHNAAHDGRHSASFPCH
ncbi:CbtB domain-containing protein [Methylobacter sp.]|uniref:CbtB domain-containing protein n=1 Tax=Methylobacter sp. TaxID=2051955 RepID=UPI001204E5CE|nr:CbtB domain-containing protein [Methylobacter sp.]TAK63940.1 MAG: CbtB-domain containing protein [Methylobacter sp.]